MCICSWLRPDGSSKSVSYSADPQLGFRAVPFDQLGVALPPYPQRLNTQNHFAAAAAAADDFTVVDKGTYVQG